LVSSFENNSPPCTNCRTESNYQKNTLFQIPVKAWVYSSSTQMGISDALVERYINDVNKAFRSNKVQIVLYLKYPIERPISDVFCNQASASNYSQMVNTYRDFGTLNIHFSRNIVESNVGGRAAYPWTNNRYTLNLKTQSDNFVAHPDLAAHEVGHAFGLVHTHQNARGASDHNGDADACFQEYVRRDARNNICVFTSGRLKCEINGDGLCDTDADSDLKLGGLGTFCPPYSGNDTDREGTIWFSGGRDNALRNYMSYHGCRSEFTLMQRGIMYHYAKYRSVMPVANPVVFNMNSDIDTYENDNFFKTWKFKENNNKIEINELQKHTFHKIPHIDGSWSINDEDWVIFEVRNAGQYTVKTSAITNQLPPDTELFLYNIDVGINEIVGTPIFITSNDNANSNTLFSQITQDLQGGYYAVRIVQKNSSASTPVTHYSLSLYCGNFDVTQIYIAGSSPICSSSTYSVLGGVGTPVWSVGPGLSLSVGANPNQISVQPTQAAPFSSWVEAQVVSSCNGQLVIVRKNIDVIPLAVQAIQIQGPIEVWRGQNVRYTINPISGATGYRWWVVPVNAANSQPISPYNCSGYFCWGFVPPSNGSGTSCTFRVGETDAQIYVEALGTSVCNSAVATLRAVYQATGCPPTGEKCFNQLGIANPFPSPSQHTLQIRIEHSDNDEEILNIFAASHYSVKVYNSQVEQKIHLPSVSGLEHTIPVQHLPQGMYYIKVFHPEIGTLEKTIVKE
jgi:hypothetical protein